MNHDEEERECEAAFKTSLRIKNFSRHYRFQKSTIFMIFVYRMVKLALTVLNCTASLSLTHFKLKISKFLELTSVYFIKIFLYLLEMKLQLQKGKQFSIG